MVRVSVGLETARGHHLGPRPGDPRPPPPADAGAASRILLQADLDAGQGERRGDQRDQHELVHQVDRQGVAPRARRAPARARGWGRRRAHGPRRPSRVEREPRRRGRASPGRATGRSGYQSTPSVPVRRTPSASRPDDVRPRAVRRSQMPAAMTATPSGTLQRSAAAAAAGRRASPRRCSAGSRSGRSRRRARCRVATLTSSGGGGHLRGPAQVAPVERPAARARGPGRGRWRSPGSPRRRTGRSSPQATCSARQPPLKGSMSTPGAELGDVVGRVVDDHHRDRDGARDVDLPQPPRVARAHAARRPPARAAAR